MLAYVESVMVDCGGFEIGADARMRSNRHNFRVMNEQNPNPTRPGSRPRGIVMDRKYGSRLNNGQSVENHDDRCCLQDFVPYGIFTVPAHHCVDAKEVLKLSEKGQKLVAALRQHKAEGGQFADFCPDTEFMSRGAY